MNIECDPTALNELADNFRYNDAVIRNMILRTKRAISEASPISKEREGRAEMESSGPDLSDRGDKADAPSFSRRRKEEVQDGELEEAQAK
jgi:small subunit ribosomal protein S6